MDRTSGRITPAHTIAVHKNDTAQHTAVIDARFSVALAKEPPQTDPSVRPSAKTDRSSSVSLQSLNQIPAIKSMDPEPN
ncbi:hypothetical protein GCM10007867_05410 [Gluconobacter cerinus]|uniref:Uncharacterized protein n=1 Tax=Gluconobacter cerinus TaxID=38307 RepID=A0AAV5NB79_9PROT|nr:hypothetical protein GCM10007867_05410 [Gluconobacter cerinus]